MAVLMACLVLAGPTHGTAEPRLGQADGRAIADDFASAVATVPCENDEPRGADGACPTVNERGFTLFSGPRTVPPTLSDLALTFMSGSAVLSKEGRRRAAILAGAMRRPSLLGVKFEIAGYTDASGPEPENIRLSQARADAVRAFLISMGVAERRLTTKGYGSSHLAIPDQPRDSRNRRVAAIPRN